MNSTEKPNKSQPRTKPAEVRLDELMDAAQQLFIDKGFEATTVSDIVRDANVAKGTFYHYFTSKNEMLAALRERFTQHFIASIQKAVDTFPVEDSVARLKAWCDAGVKAYIDGRLLHDALYHDHHHPTRGNQDRNAVLDQVLHILEEGVRIGSWTLENPRLTAILMYHGMHGAVDDILADETKSSATLGGDLARQFMHLLGCLQVDSVSRETQ
ncbi:MULTISPECIES: TetR/AcrR family transcriptional regulator [Pantoea]|uniref:TetR/AcrR family transcriptional regulator n=1 Tax=Candidatus Pantoea multigeneris TaxID=2608357 RepID=A0ABX0REC6_9GAMM|nr:MULTISPECIES: TetR/AcrR family transcriptional regulator [Pantoea]NIF21580.1 TetR/AcrR family transcriptional regulator [Pantoea multigeneris]